MMHALFIAVAVAITFAGCAILFVDVIATKKTDLCQDETPAVYLGEDVKGGQGGGEACDRGAQAGSRRATGAPRPSRPVGTTRAANR